MEQSKMESLGRKAHSLGLDIILNPYQRHTDEWCTFNNGWLAAKVDTNDNVYAVDDSIHDIYDLPAKLTL